MQTKLTGEMMQELAAAAASYTKRIHKIVAAPEDADVMFEGALGYSLSVLLTLLNANPHTIDLINSVLANEHCKLVPLD